MNYKVWISAVAFIICPTITFAGYYKYVDENGVVHFTDNPPQNLPESTEKHSEPKEPISSSKDSTRYKPQKRSSSNYKYHRDQAQLRISNYKAQIQVLKTQIQGLSTKYRLLEDHIKEFYSGSLRTTALSALRQKRSQDKINIEAQIKALYDKINQEQVGLRAYQATGDQQQYERNRQIEAVREERRRAKQKEEEKSKEMHQMKQRIESLETEQNLYGPR